MSGKLTSNFVFIIDTDTYSGNFERAMYWYMTGSRPAYMHGGCDWLGKLVQEEHVQVMPMALSIQDKLDWEWTDDTDCARPVSIV